MTKHSDNDVERIPGYAMNRREFLTFCALGTVPALLSSCQFGGSSSAGGVTPTAATPTATPHPSPTVSSSPTADDWSALARSLQGSLVLPNDQRYPTALQLFSPSFDSVHPAAIAYCASPADVQACIAFLHHFHLPFAPRSGGHSYAGYSTSTGLVIDVTRMNNVTVNAAAATATIGAGTHLIDVYAALAAQGFALPAGSCPTVGIAGLTLGGGAGVLDRKFGLTCDSLLSAQLVTADGRVIGCDANSNADLFWALRGGGGGNFGVVTSFTFRIYPLTTLSLFTLYWPWANAASVVDGWQHWAPQGPDELWSNCVLDSPANKNTPIVLVNGVYAGDLASLNTLLDQLVSRIGIAPSSRYASGASLLDTMLVEAGCYGKSVAQCHLPSQNPQGTLQRDISAVKSDYFTSLLSRTAIDNLVNAINTRHTSPLGEGGIGLDALGGAVNRVAANATAFVHRNALFSAQYSASWSVGDSSSIIAANRSWLTNTWQSMRPYASGESYQNYVDPDLPNWQQAYYGSNLPRLQRIKAAYDPSNFFHFGQSITPAGT